MSKPIFELVRKGQRVPYRGQQLQGKFAQHQQPGARADTIEIERVFANFPKTCAVQNKRPSHREA